MLQEPSKEALLQPRLSLKPIEEWGPKHLSAKCLHVKADSSVIIRGLVERGLCGAEPVKRFAVGNGKVLASGRFGSASLL